MLLSLEALQRAHLYYWGLITPKWVWLISLALFNCVVLLVLRVLEDIVRKEV